jgi:acyl-phosphate glycerol 3-phosphate acyltransferase
MATAWATLAATALAAYLVGGVPFGWLVARARGVDILRLGSGNIGATNVGRVLGMKYGVLVFLLDLAKGSLPVLAASFLPANDLPNSLPVAAGVSAFLGHLFPVYLRFRGGKGVATGVGVVAVLLPAEAGIILLAWALTVAAGGFVSLASLTAAALLCVLRLARTPEPFSRDNQIVTLFCLLATALVFARHAGNIRRLVRGVENRLPEAPAMFQTTKVLHVLAVGLWFGTVAFFTVAGGLLFPTFDAETRKEPRPLYLPPPAASASANADEQEAIRKEQAARVFGAAVSPLFPWYYGIQAGCAVVAFVTALGWAVSRRGERMQAVRVAVLAAAVACLGVGLWLGQVVNGLQVPRDRTGDVLLREAEPTAAEKEQAAAARAEFGQWHGYSLMSNFAVLALAAVATGMAAFLPAASRPPTGSAGPTKNGERETTADNPEAISLQPRE